MSARSGQDPKNGRFIKGNKLGRGRPWGIPRATLCLTYRQALERACSPQDLLEITKRAVADAKKGDHYARMFIAKALGFDRLAITWPLIPILPHRSITSTPSQMKSLRC